MSLPPLTEKPLAHDVTACPPVTPLMDGTALLRSVRTGQLTGRQRWVPDVGDGCQLLSPGDASVQVYVTVVVVSAPPPMEKPLAHVMVCVCPVTPTSAGEMLLAGVVVVQLTGRQRWVPVVGEGCQLLEGPAPVLAVQLYDRLVVVCVPPPMEKPLEQVTGRVSPVQPTSCGEPLLGGVVAEQLTGRQRCVPVVGEGCQLLDAPVPAVHVYVWVVVVDEPPPIEKPSAQVMVRGSLVTPVSWADTLLGGVVAGQLTGKQRSVPVVGEGDQKLLEGPVPAVHVYVRVVVVEEPPPMAYPPAQVMVTASLVTPVSWADTLLDAVVAGQLTGKQRCVPVVGEGDQLLNGPVPAVQV